MTDLQFLHLSPAQASDFNQIWPIFQAVLQQGDCYLFRADLNREAGYQYWMGPGVKTFIAWDRSPSPTSPIADPIPVGFYKLVQNQPDRGAHVANASFVVAPSYQGQGIGYQLGQHCIQTATALGYRALQFNAVVSTNTPAVKLWQKLGFEIVGTLPQAFDHGQFGYVDLYVMFRSLVDSGDRNVGDRSVGDRNVGDRSVGDRSVGNRSVGNRNVHPGDGFPAPA